MKKILAQSALFSLAAVLAAVLSATASAADGPIGALTVSGSATISAGDSEFTLSDQEYAYFSGDGIRTAANSQSVIETNDGLRVAFGQSSSASITRDGNVYTIDLVEGSMAVDAREGAEYRLVRNGEAVAGSEQYVAGDEPYVAAVTPEEGDVQFYMPAQMDQQQEGNRRLLAWLFGGAAALGGYYIVNDDSDPSS